MAEKMAVFDIGGEDKAGDDIDVLGGYAMKVSDVRAFFDGYRKWAPVRVSHDEHPQTIAQLLDVATRLGWEARLLERYEDGSRTIFFKWVGA